MSIIDDTHIYSQLRIMYACILIKFIYSNLSQYILHYRFTICPKLLTRNYQIGKSVRKLRLFCRSEMTNTYTLFLVIENVTTR